MYYTIHLIVILSINLLILSSVINCQTSPKRSFALGINKKTNKDKQKELAKESKVKKDIESETQRAIEDVFSTTFELTTLAIDYKRAINETNSQTVNDSNINSTLNQTNHNFVNQTNITPNVSRNDSFVPTSGETPDQTNSTQYEAMVNITTQSTIDYSTTPFAHNISVVTTKIPFPEMTPTPVIQSLNESPILRSNITSIESMTESNVDFEMTATEEVSKCVFDERIECKNFELICFGFGAIDCGSRRKRDVGYVMNQTLGPQVFKLYLNKRTQSENIQNSKCVLTAFENNYFSCNPLPFVNDCNGKTVCKPIEESTTDSDEVMPFWKIALVSVLTAIGFICFIIVAIIAFVSYNKLKVRPESSIRTDSSVNGYQNNAQNVTRV